MADYRTMFDTADAAREAAYVVRLMHDDVTALREVMALYGERLTMIAMITTGADDLARDAVQETFIQLWEARHTLNPSHGLRGILGTITRRRALDILRHEQMHGRVEQRAMDHHATAAAVVVNEGEQAIRVAELRARVQTALDELPPRCREIFLLNRRAKMSYAEIEAALGISNATIRNQMSRAVQHLAQAVARWEADG